MRFAACMLLTIVLLLATACGRQTTPTGTPEPAGTGHATIQSWPALPADGLQPWETLSAGGYVEPERVVSALDGDALFTPGVERFSDGGAVADLGEAVSLAATAKQLSHAIYRLPLSGQQPGMLSLDVNLRPATAGGISTYWVGVSDFDRDGFHWLGGFSEPQVVIDLTTLDFNALSPLGNLFVAVVAFDGEAFDIVGIGLQPRDAADTTPPAAPAALAATPVTGGLLLEWTGIIAADLAGYRVYSSFSPFSAAPGNGINALPYLEGTTRLLLPSTDGRRLFVAVTAVDASGNEGPLSPAANGIPLPSALQPVLLQTDAVSGPRELTATLTASGAELYDFDLNGDGSFEISGNTSGTATVDTSDIGIIRPAVRGTSSGGSSVAFGSVSLLISGNSRPAALATVTPASGQAPLDVTFTGEGDDLDGTIADYAWDTNGDGIFEVNGAALTSHPFSYGSAGLINAKLRVTDDQGAWDVDTVGILVTAALANSPPNITGIAASPMLAPPGTTVNFSCSAIDPDGTVAGYQWDFDNNGTFDSTAQSPARLMEDEGIFFVKLRVTDNSGGLADTYIPVTIEAGPDNIPPSVTQIQVTPAETLVGDNVTFVVSAIDTDGSVAGYSWDFDGDGGEDSSDEDPVHQFSAAGFHNAAVTVTDDAGGQSTAVIGVNVSDPDNLAPTADLSPAAPAGNAPFTVNFTAASSSDSDGTISEYQWDFDGDGNFDGFGSDPTISHVYTARGSFTARLRVIDNDGGTSTDTATVTVNGLPVASFSAYPAELEIGETVTLDGSASNDPGGSITKYEWDLDANGSYETDTGTTSYAQTSFTTGASRSLRLRVTDNATPVGQSTAAVNVVTHGWLDPIEPSAANNAQYPSLAVVNGRPAVAYHDGSDLRYLRASNAEGTSWSASVAVFTTGTTGLYPHLLVVAGNPAIAFYHASTGDLYYVRASNPNGSAWGTPVFPEAHANDVGENLSMAIISGNPAIAYFNDTTNGPRYVRATDADGSAWGTPTYIDSTGAPGGFENALAEVNGRPAVLYLSDPSTEEIRYIRADDATGLDWEGTPENLENLGNNDPTSLCLSIVNGRPAGAWKGFSDSLHYRRASDLNGDTWGSSVTLATGDIGHVDAVGREVALGSLQGVPVVAFFRGGTTEDMQFIKALNADGSSWGAVETICTQDELGYHFGMGEVNGSLSIALYSSSPADFRYTTLY